QNGSVIFLGKLIITARTGLRQTETTYEFDPGKLFSHGLQLNAKGGFDFDTAADPYIDVPLDKLTRRSVVTAYSACPLLYVLGPTPIAAYLYHFRQELKAHAGVIIGMLAACVFLILVSTTLPYNHGPDETGHMWSGAWYLTHTLPPSMASPIYYDAYW